MAVSTFDGRTIVDPGADARDELGDYRPGVCNIGPAEIARRRRGGDLGVVVTAVAFAVMVALDAPPAARLLLAIPAGGAAAGYLQARSRFCVRFGSTGVFNFGQVGQVHEIGDVDARARDRRRSIQIGLASLGVGLVVGLAAGLLPL